MSNPLLTSLAACLGGWLTLGLVAWSGGPQEAPSAGASPATARLADDVAARERDFARTMADRDHEAFARFLADEAIFLAETRTLRGRVEVAEAWRRYYEGPAAPFSWAPDRVEVLDSGRLALSSGPVVDPTGTRVGTFNSVWRLEDDGVWRVVFDKGCPRCVCP